MYNEILKLEQLFIKENIPYKMRPLLDGYQIIIYNKENTSILCDAIEHYGSHGHQIDTLEIMGGMTEKENEEESVLGYLTAEEVFKRFKYCYEHNTSVYINNN